MCSASRHTSPGPTIGELPPAFLLSDGLCESAAKIATQSKQPAGGVSAGNDAVRNLELEGISVLELVEQNALVPGVGAARDVRVAQNVAGVHQEVVKLQLAAALSCTSFVENDLRQMVHDDSYRAVDVGAAHFRADLVAERFHGRFDRLYLGAPASPRRAPPSVPRAGALPNHRYPPCCVTFGGDQRPPFA